MSVCVCVSLCVCWERERLCVLAQLRHCLCFSCFCFIYYQRRHVNQAVHWHIELKLSNCLSWHFGTFSDVMRCKNRNYGTRNVIYYNPPKVEGRQEVAAGLWGFKGAWRRSGGVVIWHRWPFKINGLVCREKAKRLLSQLQWNDDAPICTLSSQTDWGVQEKWRMLQEETANGWKKQWSRVTKFEKLHFGFSLFCSIDDLQRNIIQAV